MFGFTTYETIDLAIIIIIFVIYKLKHIPFFGKCWDFIVVFFMSLVLLLVARRVKDEIKDFLHNDKDDEK